MIPDPDDPLHDGVNGVVHPAVLAASLALGQCVADAPAIVSQNTIPGWTTHTWVAASHEISMPELPHAKVPEHELAESVLEQSPELDVELHAASTRRSTSDAKAVRFDDDRAAEGGQATGANMRTSRRGKRASRYGPITRCGPRPTKRGRSSCAADRPAFVRGSVRGGVRA